MPKMMSAKITTPAIADAIFAHVGNPFLLVGMMTVEDDGAGGDLLGAAFDMMPCDCWLMITDSRGG